MHQVGYLQRLYRNARPTERKKNVVHVSVEMLLRVTVALRFSLG